MLLISPENTSNAAAKTIAAVSRKGCLSHPRDWYQFPARAYAVPVIGRIITVTLFPAPFSMLLTLNAHHDNSGRDCEQDHRAE
jgi:hypothetical protein